LRLVGLECGLVAFVTPTKRSFVDDNDRLGFLSIPLILDDVNLSSTRVVGLWTFSQSIYELETQNL